MLVKREGVLYSEIQQELYS